MAPPAPQEPEVIVLGGVRVHLLSRSRLLSLVDEALWLPGAPLLVGSANLDHIDHFAPGAAPAPTGNWLLTLDGRPLLWMANLLTGRAWDPLVGADLLPDILALAAATGASVGFLGGTADLHAALAQRLTELHPTLRVSGYWCPRREELGDGQKMTALADDIRAAGTDVLVVALGKPRQERWLSEYAERSGVRVGLAFGAAADFLAQRVQRAPRLVSVLGFEWLFRLLHEPRRLWRRYLVRGPVAMVRLLTRSRRGAPPRPRQPVTEAPVAQAA